MKKIFKPSLLPYVTLVAGVAGFGLRLWLFLTGVDQRGLLPANHPAGILSFVLIGLMIPVLALCVRPLEPVTNYNKLFPRWLWAGIGCVAAATGILYVDIRDLLIRQDLITVLTLVLGLVASAALLILGFCRMKGKHPSFWLHAALAVYFMLHLVSQYRLWSAESQLQVYFFPLLSSVFLMLTAYHGAVLDAEKTGSRRWYVFCNQAAFLFCCMSLQRPNWPFYLAMAVWLGTGLCSLKAAKPDLRQEG